MKTFRINPCIGKVKHSISFHDGMKLHKDGSKFHDIETFKTQKAKNSYAKNLLNEGYQPE